MDKLAPDNGQTPAGGKLICYSLSLKLMYRDGVDLVRLDPLSSRDCFLSEMMDGN